MTITKADLRPRIERGEEISAHEVFEAVARHLFAQGQRSKIGPTCAYRGDGGLECAFGALIPDSAYREEFDPRRAGGLSVESVLFILQDSTPPVFQALEPHRQLARSLQGRHDSAPNWYSEDSLRAALKEVASDYDLSGTAFLDDLHFPAPAGETA
jgi:hypothetical protein